MLVTNPRFGKGSGERFTSEVRVAARPWIAADVHNVGDAVHAQEPEELGQGPCRVADRVDHSGKKAPGGATGKAHAIELSRPRTAVLTPVGPAEYS